MSGGGRKLSLTKLEEKQKELKAQIKELKRQQRREAAEQDRKRYAIMGEALARELAENDALAQQLGPIINRRVTKAKDRIFLGLEPLSKKAGQ